MLNIRDVRINPASLGKVMLLVYVATVCIFAGGGFFCDALYSFSPFPANRSYARLQILLKE